MIDPFGNSYRKGERPKSKHKQEFPNIPGGEGGGGGGHFLDKATTPPPRSKHSSSTVGFFVSLFLDCRDERSMVQLEVMGLRGEGLQGSGDLGFRLQVTDVVLDCRGSGDIGHRLRVSGSGFWARVCRRHPMGYASYKLRIVYRDA